MELRQKRLRHFSVSDLSFDYSTFNIQWGDRGTVEERFGFYLKSPKSVASNLLKNARRLYFIVSHKGFNILSIMHTSYACKVLLNAYLIQTDSQKSTTAIISMNVIIVAIHLEKIIKNSARYYALDHKEPRTATRCNVSNNHSFAEQN